MKKKHKSIVLIFGIVLTFNCCLIPKKVKTQDCSIILEKLNSITKHYGYFASVSEIYKDPNYIFMVDSTSSFLGCFQKMIVDSTVSKQDKTIIISVVSLGTSDYELIDFANKYIDSLTEATYDSNIFSNLIINQDRQYRFVKNYKEIKVKKILLKANKKQFIKSYWGKTLDEIIKGEFTTPDN